MFSTAQQAYIEALLPTYAKEGYKYYVAYTDSVGSGSYFSSPDPDLYILFSKERISAQNAYSFVVKESSVLVTIRSGNYSSSQSAINTDRVVVSNYNPGTLNVDVYEHIYTNAEFESYALQPDYYLASGGETNVQLQGNTLLIFIVVIFLVLNRLWFGKRSSCI